MIFSSAGTPPASVGGYIEDMLNELAEMADKLQDATLAKLIRDAGLAATHANAKAWAEKRAGSDAERQDS